jgi:hypothetical protein
MSGFGDKPFALVEVVVQPYDGAVLGTPVQLPSSRTLKFKTRVKSADFIGDARLQAVATIEEGVDWELEAGGMSLEALAAMTGRELISEGVTPNRKITFTGTGAHFYPYFRIFGKSLGDGPDDIHAVIYKAKITEGFEGTFEYGSFLSTSIKGSGVDNNTDGIYDFIQNETAEELETS